MKIIGITGGIASGKSTVTKMFESLGAAVLSADLDARAVLAPDSSALESVFAVFPETRRPDGSLDRSALAQRIFSSAEDKSRLEAITHPAIISRMQNAISRARASGDDGLLFYEVPLLYERDLAHLFDAVIAILATPALQAERLQARESSAGRSPLSEQEITNRLSSQMSPEEKAARADYVVRTDATLADTEKQVREIRGKLAAACLLGLGKDENLPYNGVAMRYTAPKGTHDILPSGTNRTDWADDITKWHWLEGVFRDLCGLYGYEEVRTPVYEDTNLFHRAVGEGTDIVTKETYDFVTKGGDSITLRPEGTAGVLRAYVQHRVYIERPIAKLYYIGPNFRYERPTKGRYRQHYQAGVEFLGADGPETDAEVIGILYAFFTRLGVSRLTLRLNSVGTVESRARYVEALRTFAAPLVEQMSEDNKRRFEQNPLRMLDSKDERDQQLLADAPIVTDFLDAESRAHFETLQSLLTTLGIEYKLDPFLVRGFDYYTRTLFEIESPDVGAQSSLAGGGRYNRLVEDLGGPATPGIGFGIGIERTLIALQTAGVPVPEPPSPVAFLCPLGDAARNACVILLSQLRSANLAADMDYTGRRMKGMLEQADRVRARYALIVGDDEISEGVVQVRDMQTKQQIKVPIANLAETLRGQGGISEDTEDDDD